MNNSILEYFVCPVCKKSLQCRQNCDIIETGVLFCSECGRDYPVIRGIPRLLPDSLMPILAEQLSEDFSSFSFSYPIKKRNYRSDFETDDFIKKQISTMTAFGYEWNQFTEFTKEFTHNEYIRTLSPFPPDIVKNKIVLEAGTGAGIFIDWFDHYDASHIFGMNLGLDVESVNKKTSHLNTVTIVQGDIFHLPFADKKIDFVISHGVIHHLPNPEKGFQKLIPAVKDRGEIFIWVYGKDPIVPIIELLRKILHKIPKSITKTLSWFFALTLLFLKIVYLALNKIPGCKKLAKQVPYKQYAVRSFREMQCTIMDKLFVPVVNYYDKPELESWFKSAGLKNISITSRDGNSWSCYGIK